MFIIVSYGSNSFHGTRPWGSLGRGRSGVMAEVGGKGSVKRGCKLGATLTTLW